MARAQSPTFLLLSSCLLLLLLFFFFFFFSVHGASSQYHDHLVASTLGTVSVRPRNSVAGSANKSTIVLAEERTGRKNPLDDFKRYRGGWNISDQHYWASVGFTAAPMFMIVAAWFLIFGLTLFLNCCYYLCCHQRPYAYSRTTVSLSLIFLILFTIAAIIGCIVLYLSQGKFYGITISILQYVVKQANVTVDNLHNISDSLAAAKQVGVGNISLPSEIQTKIYQIGIKINDSAVTIAHHTDKTSDQIRHILYLMRLNLIIIAVVIFLLEFLGFLFSILGIRKLVYFLILFGWMLVAGTFVLCGVFNLLHNVVADTCVAMDEWVQNPSAHTSLDDLLPCVDGATANLTLLRTKEVTYQLTELVNRVISNVSNINSAPTFRSLYHNQSGPLMPILCNPFHHDLTDRQCSAGEVNLNNATQTWRGYVCKVSSTGICTTVGRVTPDIYNQMSAAVTLGYGLYHYGPFLVRLEDCTFVRDTFAEISKKYCPRLWRYSKWTYMGLVMVSVGVMLSLIFWVIHAKNILSAQDRKAR